MATKKKTKRSSKKTTRARPAKDLERKEGTQKPSEASSDIQHAIAEYDGDDSQLPAATDPYLLALRENPEFARYEVAKRVAHSLANSGMVPDDYKGRPNDCFVAIQMGHEIGLGPFQAIQSIAVINGRPCLWGDALIGVCRNSPKCEWIEEEMSDDGKTATCRTQRKGDRNFIERSFSWDDAIEAGLHNKNIWGKHPKRMLQMRARGFCLRDAYPDILKGLSIAEEVQDFHGSPTPIQSYKLPGYGEMKVDSSMPDTPDAPPPDQAKQAEIKNLSDVPPDPEDGKPQHALLAKVERMIRDARTMEELLRAAEEAKKLKNENDIKTARHTYNQRRQILMAAEGAGDAKA